MSSEISLTVEKCENAVKVNALTGSRPQLLSCNITLSVVVNVGGSASIRPTADRDPDDGNLLR